jgi:hypothetical protein
MIYRTLLASLLATLVAVLLCAAVLADRVAALAHGRSSRSSGLTGLVALPFARGTPRLLGGLLLASAVVLVWPGIVEYASTRTVAMHWSRAVLASLLVVTATTLGVSVFLLGMMDLIQERRAPVASPAPPDRVRPAAAAPLADARPQPAQ